MKSSASGNGNAGGRDALSTRPKGDRASAEAERRMMEQRDAMRAEMRQTPLMLARLSRAVGKAVREHLRVVFLVGRDRAPRLLSQAPVLASHCVVQAIEADQDSYLEEAVGNVVSLCR